MLMLGCLETKRREDEQMPHGRVHYSSRREEPKPLTREEREEAQSKGRARQLAKRPAVTGGVRDRRDRRRARRVHDAAYQKQLAEIQAGISPLVQGSVEYSHWRY